MSTQQEVITTFVALTEKIANSKNRRLDFGSPEMTFYRGEIHMIKLIGDFPGIYSAELARKLGITRAVVQRTVNSLHTRHFLEKVPDLADKKRWHLFLSSSGQQAYHYHEDYHHKDDQALFAYLSQQSEAELASIQGFLEQASALIERHS